jgi:hypothetical protein
MRKQIVIGFALAARTFDKLAPGFPSHWRDAEAVHVTARGQGGESLSR